MKRWVSAFTEFIPGNTFNIILLSWVCLNLDTGKLLIGLFKHIWWKESCLCSAHEEEEDKNRKIRVHFLPVLRQIQGIVEENRVKRGWFNHPLNCPQCRIAVLMGPTTSYHSFQSSRHRSRTGSTVNTIAVIFILPFGRKKQKQNFFFWNAPRNFLHKI